MCGGTAHRHERVDAADLADERLAELLLVLLHANAREPLEVLPEGVERLLRLGHSLGGEHDLGSGSALLRLVAAPLLPVLARAPFDRRRLVRLARAAEPGPGPGPAGAALLHGQRSLEHLCSVGRGVVRNVDALQRARRRRRVLLGRLLLLQRLQTLRLLLLLLGRVGALGELGVNTGERIVCPVPAELELLRRGRPCRVAGGAPGAG